MTTTTDLNQSRNMVLVISVILSLASVAFAQGPPNDYQIGFPPHGDFSGTDFENYQLNNGNLHIEVPLWSTAGRGPSVGFKYVYDSLGWGFNENCNRLTGLCTDHVTPNPGKAGVVGNHLRFTLIGPQSYAVGGTTQYVACNGTGIKVYIHGSSMEAPDGTHHHFLPDPYEASGQAAYCYPHPNTLYADDGSGWIYQQNTGKLVGKDGTSVSISTSPRTVEDTNGNEVIPPVPPNAGTDTLGRQFNTDGSYYDSNGFLQTIPVTWGSVPVQTNLCGSSSGDYCYEYSSSAWNVLQSITLPNGMSYTFTYGQSQCGSTNSYYGEPCSATLPTGGQITWAWNSESDTGPILVSRQLSGDPAPWRYGGGITDPAGNQMVTTCGWYVPPHSPGGDPVCYIITKKYYQGSSTSGTLIKTVQTDYWTTNEPAILPIHETTTWNQQNLVSRTETDYDSYATDTYAASAGNPTEKREFGYGSGTWGAQVRTIDFTYLYQSNSNYFNLNILDRVTNKKVYAGSSQSGTLTAWSLNNYDGVAIAQNTSSLPAPNHDYTNFPASYNLRGNLTQANRGLKGSNGSWTWLSTNFTYNDLGDILTTTDPRGYTSTSDYTDSWAAINNPQCVTSTHSYAFPTTITDALGHRIKHSYFSCTGLLGSTQDENDIAAARPGITYSYDKMDRLVAENYPDGGQTTKCYTDLGGVTCTQAPPPLQAVTTEAITPSLNRTSTVVLDGLGRVSQTQLVDPDCSSGPVNVDYTYGYGSQGRQTQISTPYCGQPGGTYGLMTTTNYDALDRPLSVQKTDGSTTTTTYAGNCQTVTDEAGKTRQSCFDALGHMIQVLEDPGISPHYNYETDYGYDVLDDVTAVTQKGGAGSSSWRTRSFTYDSLSRLACAANPEITPGLSTVNPASCPASYTGTYTNGTIGYTYDANGNLATRTAPAPNQTSTSSTVVTTYSYDKVNRLTQKSYTGSPSTATAQYGYDGLALTLCTTTPPSVSDLNPVGTRTSICDGSGATSWTHDPMGRVWLEQRIINGTSAVNKPTQYTYYLDGKLATLAYPGSGPTVTYTPSSAGRPLSAVDSAHNYVTGATYAPQGAIAGLTYGGLIYGAITYNSRLQPLQVAYGTSQPSVSGSTCPPTAASIMQRIYDFHVVNGDNGLVQVINNCMDTNRTQNFFYDNLNRITQAYTTGNNPLPTSWGETFTTDAWGNLTNKGPVAGKTYTENLNAGPATIKNQLNGFCNDAAGNLVLNSSCPTGTLTPAYSYDIENRLTSAAAGYTYVYDGDGKRVKKCTNSGCTTGTLYWTGTGSDPLSESDFSGTFKEEYIFFNGRRVARVDVYNCSSHCVHYYFSDHLGSADVITSDQGISQKESDYYPYGGEIVVSGTDINNYKFNGKERDSESGLDNFGARYNASNLGRFMTPDWAARPTAVPYALFGDPQSLNLYGYVRNDPVSRGDADGHADSFPLDAKHSDQPCGISNVCSGSDVATDTSLFGKDQPSWQVALFQRQQQALATLRQAQTQTRLNDPSANAAKGSAQRAGEVSSTKVSGVWVNAYGGTTAQQTAELAAFSKDLTQSDRGKAMLSALEARKSGWFGLWGSPKPFDIIQMASGGSYSYAGGQAIMLDYHDVGANYTSRFGGGTYSLDRIFAHELGHAAMGNLDNGPGRMNNVNWNENPVMRQLGDFNDRTAY